MTFINGAHVKGKDKSFSLVTDLPLRSSVIRSGSLWARGVSSFVRW